MYGFSAKSSIPRLNILRLLIRLQQSIVPIVCQTSSIFHFLKESPQEWNGQLAEAATSILQQHAMQGDLTELQVCLRDIYSKYSNNCPVRWIVERLNYYVSLHYKVD